jgi:hypothetical protein
MRIEIVSTELSANIVYGAVLYCHPDQKMATLSADSILQRCFLHLNSKGSSKYPSSDACIGQRGETCEHGLAA